jgi:hypothetical protein
MVMECREKRLLYILRRLLLEPLPALIQELAHVPVPHDPAV